MRKIQMDILEAIRNKANFESGNTEVIVSDAGNIQVLLHGSPIVRIENGEKDIYISLAGWNTVTSRGRINAVMEKYGISRVVNKGNEAEIYGVFITNTGWYQVMRNGVEIPAQLA